eukprot:3074831-Rhodomonas_salina.1
MAHAARRRAKALRRAKRHLSPLHSAQDCRCWLFAAALRCCRCWLFAAAVPARAKTAQHETYPASSTRLLLLPPHFATSPERCRRP